MEIPEVIEALANTPVWMRMAIDGLPPEAVAWPPGPDEWSAADLLAHVRASDAVLSPRVFQLLIRPSAPLAGFDERRWALVAGRANVPISGQLTAFQLHREELVGVLRTLTPNEWQLTGAHETRGALSIRDIATELASHELEHRAQLEDILRKYGVPTALAATDAAPSGLTPPRSRPLRKRSSTRPRPAAK